MEMSSVAGIARSIIASGSENILDDYYTFYNDGKWMVTVARKMSSVLSVMEDRISDYPANLPKLEECIGYISDAGLDEMGTVSCAKEMREKVKELKDRYSEWEKSQPSEQASFYDRYKETISVMKDYIGAFEDSCVNSFRNRYIEDEENVRNLLDVMHSAGNFVLNGNAGKKNSGNI